AAAIGAIWSSCSPDFGEDAISDRFRQIEPTVLVTTATASYNGKPTDVLAKAKAVLPHLPTVRTRIVAGEPTGDASGWVPFADAIAKVPASFAFERFPFDHPLYILYSSGTTGVPKCIVHGAGGTLLQHLKEHQLHTDVKRGDRLFYFTTCGWMMWNWLVSGLAAEATLLLYDGSPFHPDHEALFDLADTENMTIFGTSAKYIDALAKLNAKPKDTHRLARVSTMTSTGSPLVPESYDYVYDNIKQDLLLSSISGGT